MNYTAINIQGNIVSSEILEKIRTEDIKNQKAIDFGMNPSASVRDEINLAWSLAISNWTAFKSKRENLSGTNTGTAETRRYWILPLLQIFGYELTTSNAEIINGKSYAISHRATNRDGFPIHVIGVNQSLDKRAESGGTRLSPHALVQEYLNNNEHMYALVTNGCFLRVLRDATRLSKLSFLEFDLEQIMEEGLYVEFALMYRVLHATRMPEKQDSGADSFLEFYHQEALASGSRIRERLSLAVENSIKDLANGLLKNQANQDLREKVLNGQVNAKDYYLFTLRLVYRVLFLLVIEERKLIYPEKRNEELNQKRSIYYDFYSIQRLTKLAEKLIYVDPRKTDLWQSLITTFALFEHEEYGKKLGISPLGAGIFSPNALGIISQQHLDNESLLRVLRYLVTFENENGQRVRVNYADLDVEEFGSVYEGLLEYDPVITDNAGEPIFGFVEGDDRSSSGSHYTPEELVRPLIKHSLDYLIEDKLKEADPEKGLLSLTICDVACGSGHILLSAARRVGFELAKVRSKEDQPTPSVLRVAVRDVIKNCVYGVDLNPLAVELCKVALWLEAHEPGEPLNFLDHHIKCGNAIVGLAHANELEKGIASEAFKTLKSDHKVVASAFKKRNDQERKNNQQLSTYDLGKVDDELKDVQSDFEKFTKLPETNPEQIKLKEKAYKDLTNGKKWWRLKNLADLQVAQFFIPKTTDNNDKLTTHSQYMTYLKQGTQIFDRGASMAISEEKRFFHWFLEFPEVFNEGGFDCILGNPPYKGGSKLSSSYGHSFTNYLSANYLNTSGLADLIAFFIRRNDEIVSKEGFSSIISTNTISQGETRESSLDYILKGEKFLNFILKSIVWPGKANTVVSLFSITGKRDINRYIGNKCVDYISSTFDNLMEAGNPYRLSSNLNKCYTGSLLTGKGFVVEESFLNNLIKEEIKHVKLYLTGDNLTSSLNYLTNRFSIDVNNLSYSELEKLSNIYSHLHNTVRAERSINKNIKLKEEWWKFEGKRQEMYNLIKGKEKLIIISQTIKHLVFSRIHSPEKYIFSKTCTIIIDDNLFPILQSFLINEWTWKYGTTMGASTIRFISTSCFDTFPFIYNLSQKSLDYSEDLDRHKLQLHNSLKIGQNNIYNLYHDKSNNFNEIEKLRNCQVLLDNSIINDYSWNDIQLLHDFYEVDYLPDDDSYRVRFTIHPDARKEVLKRLLELNHKIHEEELEAGLFDKKPIPKPKKKKRGNPDQNELF